MTDSQENTYVFDVESPLEMARLIEQDRHVTETMGGPLTDLPKLPGAAQVLDLGCGPGGWVLNAAYERPDIEVAGVDISRIMIDYAIARACSQRIANASFGMMNITNLLDFSNASFDLVNARFLFGVLRRVAWVPFIAECTRIVQPGGILRLTEPLDFGVTTSPAIERMLAAGAKMMWKRGYGFSVDGRSYGLHTMLPSLLRKAGYLHVHTQAYTLEFSAGAPGWEDFYHNYELTFLQSKFLWIMSGVLTEEEADQLYQQMFIDMNQPDFRGVFTFMSIIGEKTR